MLQQWAPTSIFLVLSSIVPISALSAAALVRVRARSDSPIKYDTYECGEIPDGDAWIQFHPRYYIVALIFVLFDVEVAFLFPWALINRSAGLAATIEVFLFLGVLMLGWLYALRKGALKWQ